MGHLRGRTAKLDGPRKLIVGLSGSVGSGKSTVAQALATFLDGQVAAFGDFVRHLAQLEGNDLSRAVLQNIGQARVDKDPAGFVNDFLDWANPSLDSPLIIDGIRHVLVHQALGEWASAEQLPYVSILLKVSAEERAARRSDGDVEKLKRIDSHPVERETADDLPALVDLIVEGEPNLAELAESMTRLVSSDLPAEADASTARQKGR